MITHIIIVIGVVYFGLLTAKKHNFPLHYENWYDNLKNSTLKKILPENYCELCFITQSSVIVSAILAILLHTSLLTTIIAIPCSVAYIISIEELRQ